MATGFCVALFFPLLPSVARAEAVRLWSRAALQALGVTLVARGETPGAGSLIVANHVSWLDVLAISAVCPASFVCKQEIASWPLLGWLLKQAGTLFMRRASAWSAWRTVQAMAPRLSAGATIAVFPEGTTTAGNQVLRFFPALFQLAVNAGARIQPVALSFTGEDGRRRYEAVYAGETSFGESLCAIAAAADLVLNLELLPAFGARGLTRRQAARRAQELIASRIGHLEVAGASYSAPMLRAA
jgi:1-acyl-sn-glycerol-3-phosphate acyltransferase